MSRIPSTVLLFKNNQVHTRLITVVPYLKTPLTPGTNRHSSQDEESLNLFCSCDSVLQNSGGQAPKLTDQSGDKEVAKLKFRQTS